MTTPSIGVAVIGAAMAGRAHANGYRSAPTVFGEGLPDVRLVAIAETAHRTVRHRHRPPLRLRAGRDELAGHRRGSGR